MTEQLQQEIKEASLKFRQAKNEVSKVIVGQKDLLNCLMIALLADGHLLLEGVPGLAKTLSVLTLAKVVQCDFKRIQFTPDLLPADLLGTSVYNPKEGTFSINKGPIFTNILLADEINRAPAKVQSALLEVMQERQVTIAGVTFKAASPYLVLATQNPIEQEGTYPLPEAETDRFMMKVKIDYPSKEEEKEILKRMSTLGKKPEPNPLLTSSDILEARKLVDQIYIDPKVVDFILDIIAETRDVNGALKGLLQYGASPRASIALIQASKAFAFLEGRHFVTPNDVKSVVHGTLRHRLRRSYEAEAEEITPDHLIDSVLNKVLVP